MKKAYSLLWLNITFILAECAIAALCYLNILAMDYGWNGRMNRNILLGIIAIQIMMLILITKAPDTRNKRRLYLGQLVLILCIAVWIGTSIQIHY